MAKKLGTIFFIGSVAAAAGVAVYLKRDELKKITDDILAKIKPTEEEGVYTADLDEDGQDDLIMADTDGDGMIDAVMMDCDGDGKVDCAAIDTDGDGEADTVVEIQPQECTAEDFAE